MSSLLRNVFWSGGWSVREVADALCEIMNTGLWFTFWSVIILLFFILGVAVIAKFVEWLQK